MGTKTKRTTGCPSCGRPDCRDSRCRGLECLERPRFFSGQLLTEGELNAEQAYVLAKNRLHNLHLHGWGVVCGLEVTCHDCDGWVTVHPGYAIDSCGNDVIVCCPHDLDVMGEIERCKAARRKGDCYCPPGKDCNEQREEHWCITLSYLEKEARPTATLHEQAGSCGCGPGCKCGGKKHADECGCKRPTGAERAKAGVGKVPYACEPTRILESYRLEVCEAGEESCFTKKSKGEQQWIDKFTACLDNLKRSLRKMPLEGTRRLATTTAASAGISVTPGAGGVQPLPPLQLQQDFCDLRDFLIELFEKSPGNLHCALLDRLRSLECRRPAPNDDFNSYWEATRLSTQTLLSILLIYLKDCLCHALLPPCAPCCPGDEPLILACVTVRDGKIQEICNYSCRRWAGAFPPSMFGIYLGPIWPLAAKFIGLLCCGDFLENGLRATRSTNWVRQTADLAVGSDFATASFIGSEAADFLARARAEPSRVTRIQMTHFIGRQSEEAVATARRAGVTLLPMQVETAPPAARWAAVSEAEEGETLIAYSVAGRIVGFARPGSAEATVLEQGSALARMQKQIDDLTAVVYGQQAGGSDAE